MTNHNTLYVLIRTVIRVESGTVVSFNDNTDNVVVKIHR